VETSKRFAKRVLGSLKKITKRRYMKIMVTGVIMMGIACGLIMEGSAVYTISVDGEDLGYISSKRELNEIIETVDSELHDILEEEYEKGDIYDIVTVTKSLVSEAEEADDEIKDTIMETVDGVEKISVKVTADTTVTVTFTKQAGGNEQSSGCGSAIGSAASVLLGVAAAGVALLLGKKKED